MKILKGGDDFMAEMEASFGPPQEFQPTVTYIPDGDCIEFFARPGRFYAKRLDDVVTVYLSQHDDQIVGSLIKGVKSLCAKILERCPGFKIEIDDGKILLEHMFLACLWTSDKPTEVWTYRKLIEVAEQTKAEAQLGVAA